MNIVFQCALLNISYCPPSEIDLSHGKKLVRIHFIPHFFFHQVVKNDIVTPLEIYQLMGVFSSLDCCCLQFSWMEERRCNSNSCEYFYSGFSVLYFEKRCAIMLKVSVTSFQ